MEPWSLVALVVRYGLALIFAIAAIGKLRDLDATREATRDLALPASLVPFVAIGLPLAESAVAVGLIVSVTSSVATMASLALVVAFSVVVARQLLRGRRPNCNCFGSGHQAPIGPLTLMRNGVLAGTCIALLVRWNGGGGTCSLGCPSQLSTAQTLGVAVGGVGVGFFAVHSWLLIHLVRQRGEFLERIEHLEGSNAALTHAGKDALTTAERASTQQRHRRSRPGPGIGAPAPRFALRNVQDAMVTIDDLVTGDTPSVFVFLGTHCEACLALATEIGERAVSDGPPTDRRLIALVDGTIEHVAGRIDARGFTAVLIDEGGAISERYGVSGTPSAVVVLPDGRISSVLAEGRAAASRLVYFPALTATTTTTSSTGTDAMTTERTASTRVLTPTEASIR